MGLWYIKFKKWWFTSISFWFEVNYGTAIINGSLRQHIATALEFMWTQHVREVPGLKKKVHKTWFLFIIGLYFVIIVL